jgi:septum formation protein
LYIEPVLVIAADTTVVIDNLILGKPASADEARAMLQQLRDRQHLVHTGLCVIDTTTGRVLTEAHTAIVTMRNYTDAEIDTYIDSGDPLDKAGAYGIQHPIFRPVSRLDGCFLGVMGLSLCHLLDVLHRIGAPGAIDPLILSKLHEGYYCPLLAKLSAD